jgi:hypothetical protein
MVISAAPSTHSHRQDWQSRFISALRRARRTRVRCSGRVLAGGQGCRRVGHQRAEHVAGQSVGGDLSISISNVERPERLSPAWPLSRACAGAWTMQRRRDLSLRSRARGLRSRARVCPRECPLSHFGGPPITLGPASVIPQTCLIAGSPPSAHLLARLSRAISRAHPSLLSLTALHCTLSSEFPLSPY